MTEEVGPHWDEHNPWRDTLVYVPLTDLARCTLEMGGPDRITPKNDDWSPVRTLAYWAQYGTKLDAYILNGGGLLQAGVRYGPEGHHYLSGMFSLPKLAALLATHRPKKGSRATA